jgi:hypothetical protein
MDMRQELYKSQKIKEYQSHYIEHVTVSTNSTGNAKPQGERPSKRWKYTRVGTLIVATLL